MQDSNWHRSSHCADLNCVEVRHSIGQGIQVRDSKLGNTSPTLTFTRDEWDAFIKGVKDGEFDLP